jgi:hypothetical protein
MSKTKNNDQPDNNPADSIPENDQPENNTGDSVSENNQPNNNPAESNSDVLTIEEHKINLKIDAPVFAAVVQLKGWCSGKRMPETVFKQAVEEFLGAPMGGE